MLSLLSIRSFSLFSHYLFIVLFQRHFAYLYRFIFLSLSLVYLVDLVYLCSSHLAVYFNSLVYTRAPRFPWFIPISPRLAVFLITLSFGSFHLFHVALVYLFISFIGLCIMFSSCLSHQFIIFFFLLISLIPVCIRLLIYLVLLLFLWLVLFPFFIWFSFN